MSTTRAGDGATLDERAAALRADGVPYVHARVVLAEHRRLHAVDSGSE